MPVESTRYMIWHELPRHHISIEPEIDLERIGLKTWMLNITPARNSVIASSNGILGPSTGVVYAAKIIPGNSFIAFLAIPKEEQDKLTVLLGQLGKEGFIQNYSLEPVSFFGHIPLNGIFYDFTRRMWSFSWKDVESYEEQLRQKELSQLSIANDPTEHERIYDFDQKDILILKEFQKRIPRSISKLSKVLGIDQHNLRYHYNEHARPAIIKYNIRTLPEKPEEQ